MAGIGYHPPPSIAGFVEASSSGISIRRKGVAVVAPLVGYLADITDIPVLDVIKNNQKVMEKVLEGKCHKYMYLCNIDV